MADIVVSKLVEWFAGLTAAHEICTLFEDTFTEGENLFVLYEPSNEISTKCITLIPYGGGPPTKEGDRQEGNIQIRLKINDIEAGLKIMQSIINYLHGNTEVCNGRIYAIQSVPIPLEVLEGGEYFIFVANFSIKYTKL